MRLVAFKIRNYGGLALAEATGLDAHSTLFLSGKNGTGKSLIFEAILGAWTQRGLTPARVGPWGDDAYVEIQLRLTKSEFDVVNEWHLRAHSYSAAVSYVHTISVNISRTRNSSQWIDRDKIVEILQSPHFQEENAFSTIDLLAANRQSTSGNVSAVDLSMFDRRQMIENRNAGFEQQIEYQSGHWLPDIGSYLLTLDYQTYLADRQGIEAVDDFKIVADAFELATDKKLLRPRYESETATATVQVQLPAGPKHGLDKLSSGEKEMLSLLYFVRRISSAGGILLLDEPEKHLHPSLQSALFSVARDLSERSQVVVVTHSPSLISSGSAENVIIVNPPTNIEVNQIAFVSQDRERLDLLRTLGVDATAALQYDLLLIVEGASDALLLRQLFPELIGRCQLVEVGGAKAVQAAATTIGALSNPQKYLGVRDLDLLSSTELAALESDVLFVWHLREIENCLLDPSLLFMALTQVMPLDRDAFDDKLTASVAPLIEDVVEDTALRAVRAAYPSAAMSGKPGPSNRPEAYLRDESAVLANRAAFYLDVVDQCRSDITSVWAEQWQKLVDAKVALRVIQSTFAAYRNVDQFMYVLCNLAKEGGLYEDSAELQRFRAKLVDALGR